MDLVNILNMFSYPFVLRAFGVGIIVSLCGALLGVILVLKHYSLIGHGLGDVGFAGLALGLALGLPPLWVATPIVIFASFIIMAVSQRKGVYGDVAIGIAATASLGIGVVITSLSKGFNMDVASYMFGSILAVETMDLVLAVVLGVVVLGTFLVCYNRFFLMTSDEDFARASGIKVGYYQFLISLLTALTVVIGMKMMGSLLISSLIIFPAVTGRKLVKSFKGLVLVAGLISVSCFIIGMILSFVGNVPTGASIVLVNVFVLLVVTIFTKVIKRS